MWYKNEEAQERERFNKLYNEFAPEGNLTSIGHLLSRAARLVPDNDALIYKGKKITYRELYKQAVECSLLLRLKGVKPRDRVLLLLNNSPEFYVAYFGIIQLGAVVAALNVFLKERELAHIIHDAQPSLIITSAEFVPMLTAAGVELPPIITQEDMIREGITEVNLDSFKVTSLEPEEMAALLYTSGTTGFPKGVMLSSKNILINVMQGVARFDLKHSDRIFGVLPLFHSFAQNTCVWASVLGGSTVILVPKIDRNNILEGLQYNPTAIVGVPAFYGLLCLLKTAQFPAVRYFISGGDALPDKIRAAFALIYRRVICSGYGLTEASPFVSGDFHDELISTSTIGRPMIDLSCSLRNEADEEVAQGQVGQLWIKGPNVMLGYYNAPDMTHAVIKDGWLNTGDLAYLDDKKRLVIAGRIRDIIKHKGFIIYPAEVENVIMSHQNVLAVGVIGKFDEETGEIPIAFVQIRHDQPTIEKELRALCMKNLATYKVPRDFYCSTQQLPTTSTGKVDKKKLRAESVS